MTDELFTAMLVAVFALILNRAFRTLPHERWQILAAMPREKNGTGEWTGENLTYYGLFNANAYVLAVIFFIFLMAAASVSMTGILVPVSILLGLCIPASKLVARVVEKKKYTFTVGGASFVGIVAAPWVVWLVNHLPERWTGGEIPVLVFLAALSVAYAFGEGIGRLACISFGCCYGKPLSLCHPLVQKIFSRYNFVFSGKTKKIAYADNLDGEKVVPVQAVTAIFYCGAGIFGVYLFLKGFYLAAFLESLCITQLWRSLSEFFRADYRGNGKISAYQIMSIVAVGYAQVPAILFPVSESVHADILTGMRALWHPGVILLLQALWIFIFFYTGRSRVTAASLSFHVLKERT